MYNIIIARHGEAAIKGANKHLFEKQLVNNIKIALEPLGKPKVYKEDTRVCVDVDDYDIDELVESIKKVFGVFYLSPSLKLEPGYESLVAGSLDVMREKIKEGAKTFKVVTKRADKSFPMKSQEISADIGGLVLKEFDGQIKVDVVKPDVILNVELRKNYNLIFVDKIMGFGGLPIGINGKAITLLSGGIDSPVSSWMVSKRGMYIEAVHFHSFPFTSKKSQEKVKDLVRTLSKYCGRIRLHNVNLLPIQKEIQEKCPDEQMTILSRRFMMKIAERIGNIVGAQALVTGESLGQVASQTIEGLTVTNNAVEIMPVLRPLISLDKEEIIKIAREIGTFEISIIPEEDCCTVFLPPKPVTKPKLEKILNSEANLEVEKLVSEAIENREVIEFRDLI